MSSKAERLRSHIRSIDKEEPAKERATQEAKAPIATRSKNKEEHVMINNMTGKPIPDTFVTADDRRSMHGSSTPAHKTDATPVSILKKDKASSSIKTSESSAKDVRFTSPERDGKSGSQDASSATLGSTTEGGSSKAGAVDGSTGAGMTDDRKKTPTTSTSGEPSGITGLDDVTPPRVSPVKDRSTTQTGTSKTQAGTPSSIPSLISATSPDKLERPHMSPAQKSRAMSRWDVSMSDYLCAPHNAEDDVPFQDYSFGSGYTSSKIDKILQEPYLDTVKTNRSAMIEQLEDILGDEVTRTKGPSFIGATPTGVETVPKADEGEPLKIPRHFKKKVDFDSIVEGITDAANNYVPKEVDRSTLASTKDTDGEETSKKSGLLKRAGKLFGSAISRKKQQSAVQQPVMIWDGLKKGMSIEEPTDRIRELYNELPVHQKAIAQN